MLPLMEMVCYYLWNGMLLPMEWYVTAYGNVLQCMAGVSYSLYQACLTVYNKSVLQFTAMICYSM